MADDSFLTIADESRGEYTEKRSRFLSFAYHVESVDDVKLLLSAIQKEYYDARHVCYAYMLGHSREEWRLNDNGEPSGTAGKPIMGQINSATLTDILVVVVRYFGGVKLGTSGLIEAYREAARRAIERAQIITKYVEREITILYDYSAMNFVMRLVKEYSVQIVQQDYGEFDCNVQEMDRVAKHSAKRDFPFECKIILRSRQLHIDSIVAELSGVIETEPIPRMMFYLFSRD